MLTAEHLDTAAVYGDTDNLGLKILGMHGKIIDRNHGQDCIDEIAQIIGGTNKINEESVSTDWLMMPEELAALVSLAFAIKELNQ